jgi:catechol 2,3-dioxygenase-like lactoylglutathione lyase family enzyme
LKLESNVIALNTAWLYAQTFSKIRPMKNADKNPFKDSQFTTILVVSDLVESKSFYIDKLGAELYREYGGTSVVLRFIDHWILLVLPAGPSEDKPEIHFQNHKDKNIVSHSFTIRVQNCQESFKILHSRGVEFITPPFDRGAEIRCFFKDPDNHLFEISEYRISA